MAEVVLKNISKIYDDGTKAVNNVDIKIEDKEFAVLVGPSGCGKSTTLRMIAGLEDISEGELLIDGELVNDKPPKDRDIAMVFQNYALYPHMTVYDNMAFGLKLRKFSKSEIESRVKEASNILGIEDILDKHPKALSGGQKQRVAVGRAIVRKPKVFLFDEPLSNLDAKLRVQMRTEISKLHQKLGVTMIYVTHDQTEAMTMADKIILLNKGKVNQIDAPLEMYDNPVNKFVGGFIGSPAMNFLEGKLVVTEENKSIEFLNYNIRFNGSVLFDKLKKYSQKVVSIGIRPEDIKIASDETDKNLIEVKIDVIEPMGNEIFLYFTLTDSQLIARVKNFDGHVAGKNINIHLNPEKIHLFEKDTGKTIK